MSSAWLLSKLGWLRRLRARYCYGDVIFHDGTAETITFHCWVEIGRASSAERLVIDLTCDQFDVFMGQSVICASHGSLMDRSIEYKALNRYSFDQLRYDSVWPRFKMLEGTAQRFEERRPVHWVRAGMRV